MESAKYQPGLGEFEHERDKCDRREEEEVVEAKKGEELK